MTLQALSEEDRRQWLEAMDGTEPTYSPGMGPSSTNSMNSKSFLFVLSECKQKHTSKWHQYQSRQSRTHCQHYYLKSPHSSSLR